MKSILLLIPIFILFACSPKSEEPAVDTEKQIINKIDSIVAYSEANKSNFLEIPVLTDDFGDEYSFISKFSENGNDKFYLEQVGNDTIFYDNFYFWDNAYNLIYFKSQATEVVSRKTQQIRYIYFDKFNILKDSSIKQDKSPETILRRFDEIKEVIISKVSS